MNIRDEPTAGPARFRPRRRVRAALPARRLRDAGGEPGTVRRLRAPARASRGRRPRHRWGVFPALALLALLSCWAPMAGAAFDPTVEAVQKALVERGFEPGVIDGAMGSRTRNALRKFQRSVGLPPTGKIDAATRVALGLDPPAPDPAPDPAPAASTPAPAAEADTAPEAGTEAPATEPPPAPPAPKPVPKPVLRFATLGWHPPGTGAEVLERFAATGVPPDFRRGRDSLFVPQADLVFVLHAGERVPGLDCDPGAYPLSAEFVFGLDGPVIFTPTEGGELCRMGIGIALEVGGTIEMRPVDWDDAQYPQGTVRVTWEGLRYAD